MAVNKSNGLLKILAFVMLLIVIAVFVIANQLNNQTETKKNENEVVYDLSDEEAQALGVTAGDTPHDTLKTLLGALKDTREEVKKANERSERAEAENQRLRDREADVDSRIANEVENRVATRLSEAWDSFNQQLTGLKERAYGSSQQGDALKESTSEMPIGGASTGFGREGSGQSGVQSSPMEDGIRWVMPSDVVMTDEQGRPVSENYTGKTQARFATPFKAESAKETETGSNVDSSNGATNSNGASQSQRTPYYTIPDNSTLMGGVTMTALIGRVPVNGTVTDPYPFKAIIGRENLIANGIVLPDVEGAIVSGTASGDWTLSCVRANINSITFVFSDGRISNGRASSASALSGNEKQSLGWLSSASGVQCIPGDRKTNAPEYLSTQFLLAGADAAASSLAQGQTTAVVQDGSIVGAVTGSSGKFILGQALSGGLKEMENWYRQRYGQMFDAIYVPLGQSIAVHISTQIEIDYDSAARKVKYANKSRKGGLD